MDRTVEILVIGAGQSGLAMGYYLKQHRKSFVLVDGEKKLGDVWRNRYDSLVLFTPRSYSSLPGLSFPGDPEGLPDKEEVADYLESYANHFDIPVHSQTTVRVLDRMENGLFRAVTNQGEYYAKQVVVATGPFRNPFVPKTKGTLSLDVYQIHSGQFRSSSDLQPGSVLVAGGGNTGVQLAIELSRDREVFLSLGENRKVLPLRFLGKSIFWWFDKLGFLETNITTKLGRWISKQKDPIFGLGPALRSLVRQEKIQLLPKLSGFEGKNLIFQDQSQKSVNNIVWATGFSKDFSWIHIPGLLDPKGSPLHQRGKSSVPNLYFLGLPWQFRRGSALLGGVGRDAEFIMQEILCDEKESISRTDLKGKENGNVLSYYGK
ncbi:flavin-containing monooxygenase [Brevibacillus centrosporus]|uniref:flavin-containing monooxygenase n=1 Tax=Brevibacillus centrosporus TaxID=54910 RepID=UPI003B01DBCA